VNIAYCWLIEIVDIDTIFMRSRLRGFWAHCRERARSTCRRQWNLLDMTDDFALFQTLCVR
jgi:hypothetical protein